MTTGTYIIRDPSRNYEEIYVGKGRLARAHSHARETHNVQLGRRLEKMMRNGIAPDVEWIPQDTEREALDLEIEFIAMFGRCDIKTGTLLNRTDGGEGTIGYIKTDDHKSKVGKARSLKAFNPISNAQRTASYRATIEANPEIRKIQAERCQATKERNRKEALARLSINSDQFLIF